MDIYQKKSSLEQYLSALGNVAIAFSGGVDSTFLLKVAQITLGEKVLAVTARSLSFPERELNEARRFAAEHHIRHEIVDSEELDIEGFSCNPLNRCYLCKSELFNKIIGVAARYGIQNIAEGSNTDDNGDFRPGLIAVGEAGVHSPLREAGLSKEEIRQLSRDLALPTWSKQSFACLSSRFPYGEEITPQRLKMIDLAEQYLLDLGLRQVRVRYHGGLARIETDSEGQQLLWQETNRTEVYALLKNLGFDYVSVDLIGYRTGSMNETISANVLRKAGQNR